jgi:carbamoylphosphate synthase large subunit
MKVFKDKVRWNFNLETFGYGRNVKEALYSALRELESQIDDASHDKAELEAIELNEVVSIDEDDIEDNL